MHKWYFSRKVSVHTVLYNVCVCASVIYNACVCTYGHILCMCDCAYGHIQCVCLCIRSYAMCVYIRSYTMCVYSFGQPYIPRIQWKQKHSPYPRHECFEKKGPPSKAWPQWTITPPNFAGVPIWERLLLWAQSWWVFGLFILYTKHFLYCIQSTFNTVYKALKCERQELGCI